MTYTMDGTTYDVAVIGPDIVLQSRHEDVVFERGYDDLLIEAGNIIATHPGDFLTGAVDYILNHVRDESNIRSYIEQHLETAKFIKHE